MLATCAGALVIGALGVSAPMAQANRTYGAFDPVQSLLTFEVSDTGREIRAATVRMWLYCPEGYYSFQYPATFAVVRRPDLARARNRDFLIVRRSVGGELHARIRAVWGTATDHSTYSGTLTVSRVRARSARVHLVIRSAYSRDRHERCRGELDLPAKRDPGVLYVGATDDDEPVWVRRVGKNVEWLSGFGTGCKPHGYTEGIHADLVAMTSPTAFGWRGMVDGFWNGDGDLVDLSVHIAGTLGPRQASGTFRVVGTRAGGRGRCDTGWRKWRAAAT